MFLYITYIKSKIGAVIDMILNGLYPENIIIGKTKTKETAIMKNTLEMKRISSLSFLSFSFSFEVATIYCVLIGGEPITILPYLRMLLKLL